MTSKSDDRKWGWMIRGGPTAQGSFDTREQALEAARSVASCEAVVGVGRVTWPSAQRFRPSPGLFLASMDQAARDEGFLGERIFIADEADLAHALFQLVRAHVGTGHWTLRDIEWQPEPQHVHLWQVVTGEGLAWELCTRCGQSRRLG